MGPKTLHLTNCWHETSGGIATFYRALMDQANRQGREIRLVVPGEKDSVENAGRFGKIYYVQAPQAPFNSRYRILYPSQFLSARSKLQQILRDERPDLVEICDKYALNYLGALLRRNLLPAIDFRPVVVGLSCERMDDNFSSYIGRLPFARRFCAAYVQWVYFPFFDHHIANSAYTAQELREASRGHLTSRNTWILPMGINLEHLSPSRRSLQSRRAILDRCKADEKSRLLLYAGRLAPEKNLQLLFESFVTLRHTEKHDFRLLIAGDGIERAEWESFCHEKAPGSVTFLGYISEAVEMADLLANSDAFVHPNPREPFGIAPLQAMASGLPLIAPDCGGITTYANSDNAWLARPCTESFVFAIQNMFANDCLRQQRIQNALQTASELSWEKATASFFDLYSELCSRASSNTPLPAPDFASSSAEGWQRFCSQKISRAAERLFQLAANNTFAKD